MANPQKEDGYTPIANKLIEAVYNTNFTATEFKIILLIMRYTYGFSRKEHQFSLTFISRGISISKRYVSASICKLIEDNILQVVKEHTDTNSRILRLNKNFDTWRNRTTIQQMNYSSTVEAENNTTDELQFNPPDEPQFHQDKQLLKQNLKQDNIIVCNSVEQVEKFTDGSFEMLCVESIIHSCLELYPNSKVPSTYKEKEKWALEIDRMKRIDHREEEEIKKALKFAVNDSFWKANIRSAKKLREKFETLLIQADRKTSGRINKGQESQNEFFNNLKEWYSETR